MEKQATQTPAESLQIEVGCLSSPPGNGYSMAQVVGLDEVGWVEKVAAEWIIFSREGLLHEACVWHRDTKKEKEEN